MCYRIRWLAGFSWELPDLVYKSMIVAEGGPPYRREEEGVNVELKIVEDIDANLQAFVDGKADAAFGLQSEALHSREDHSTAA